jgi:hypothetical protein
MSEGIDFNKEVDTLSEQDVITEMNSIQGDRSSPYWNHNHLENTRYQDRMTALYNRRYGAGEAERQAVPEPDRALRDTLVKEGITPDAIQRESEEGKLRLQNEKISKARSDGLSYLRTQWGAETEAKMQLADAVVDGYFSDKDLQWMEETGAGSDPMFITMLSDLASYLNTKYFGNKLTGYKSPRREKKS